MKERRASQKLSSKSIMDPNQNVKCKIVVVGDSQCGKTALLHVFAKDCFPEVSVGPARASRSEEGLWILWLPPLHPFFFFQPPFSPFTTFPWVRLPGKGKWSGSV